ncbi:hypothetical protein D3C87_2092100 [compost metagenome]
MQNDNELIPSQPGNDLVITRGLQQSARNLLEQHVACRMAVCIVHPFESVQIQIQNA